MKKLSQQQKRAKLRKKADRLLQELVRSLYDTCLICPKPLSCGHHYFPKSTSASLRYDMENIIPLCAGHHLRHHCGDPEVHNRINEIKGEEWLEDLRIKKRNRYVNISLGYYEDIIKTLQKL